MPRNADARHLAVHMTALDHLLNTTGRVWRVVLGVGRWDSMISPVE